MKDQQLYQELKKLADQLDIAVAEHNLKLTGIPVRSGVCRVRDQTRCIIDKHLHLQKKIEILSECLSRTAHEDIFVVPAVREHLARFSKVSREAAEATAPDGAPEREE